MRTHNATLSQTMQISTNPNFSDPEKANTLVRSSDGIDFYVQTFYLTSNSTFFEDLFTRCVPDEKIGDMPVAELEESSRCVEVLLSLCCRYTIRDDISLVDIEAVMTAIRKYCMEQVEKQFRAFLVTSTIITQTPLPILLLAMRYEWPEVSQAAAYNTLLFPQKAILQSDQVTEKYLDEISAAKFSRLFSYREKCSKAAWSVVSAALHGNQDTPLRYTAFDTRSQSCSSCTLQRKYWGDNIWNYFHSSVITYLTELMEKMEVTPRGTFAEDTTLVNQLLRGGYKCSSSDHDEVYADMLKITKYLSQSIDEAVSKVELDIKI